MYLACFIVVRCFSRSSFIQFLHNYCSFLALTLLLFQSISLQITSLTIIVDVLVQSEKPLNLSPPTWVILLKLVLSVDIEKNPGDFKNGFLSFCTWNLNSLAKDEFKRAKLLEAHNSLYNYDLIGLCETSLNDTTEIPETLLENYTFVKCNNPNNTKHGGVGLLYKTTLPLKVRTDLSFDESIVVELKFGRKKIFFAVIYRSPSSNYNT